MSGSAGIPKKLNSSNITRGEVNMLTFCCKTQFLFLVRRFGRAERKPRRGEQMNARKLPGVFMPTREGSVTLQKNASAPSSDLGKAEFGTRALCCLPLG